MELLFNDASLHGQFDIESFRLAVGRLMAVRQAAHRYGRELKCNRNVSDALISHDRRMPSFIQFLRKDERRSLQLWLTRAGHFWEDFRQHSEDEWVEVRGELVTGTAVAEAAHAVLHGHQCALVSADPSNWLNSPIPVDWRSDGNGETTSVENYWTADALEGALQAVPMPFKSWVDVEKGVKRRYPGLRFAQNAFEPLSGHPFSVGAAKGIVTRLRILEEFKGSFGEDGRRTQAGNDIYQEYFTGSNAHFSDSSATEKNEFRSQLMFRHPTRSGESLFCTWHGKVKAQQLRIHFSWPVRAEEPLFIVYIGPKITKR